MVPLMFLDIVSDLLDCQHTIETIAFAIKHSKDLSECSSSAGPCAVDSSDTLMRNV